MPEKRIFLFYLFCVQSLYSYPGIQWHTSIGYNTLYQALTIISITGMLINYYVQGGGYIME